MYFMIRMAIDNILPTRGVMNAIDSTLKGYIYSRSDCQEIVAVDLNARAGHDNAFKQSSIARSIFEVYVDLEDG